MSSTGTVVAYNGTIMAGGDSLTQDLNIWYEVCRLLDTLLTIQHTDSLN